MRKITVSLPSDLVDFADHMAKQTHSSRSQVISQALAEIRSREQARLAKEGYQFYAAQAIDFAQASNWAASEALTLSTGGDLSPNNWVW